MWSAEYQKEFSGVSVDSVWKAWTDIKNWPKWDSELETTTFEGKFEVGAQFQLRPKGGPNVNLEITELNQNKTFTDVTKFPLARMHDYHEITETPQGLILKSRIYVTGPLGWLWRRLVAQGVADGVPAQMESLVEYARKQKK